MITQETDKHRMGKIRFCLRDYKTEIQMRGKKGRRWADAGGRGLRERYEKNKILHWGVESLL